MLDETHDIHGSDLLRRITFDVRKREGFSYHFNLAQEILEYLASKSVKVFAVVCFEPRFRDFACADDQNLDPTFQYLFERIDRYMKRFHPTHQAKLIFDDRGRQTNEKNARAITNFFARSTLGRGFDSLVRVPFFSVSKGHNHVMDASDIVTTVIALRFQGERRADPLWRIVHDRMILKMRVGDLRISSLKPQATSCQRIKKARRSG